MLKDHENNKMEPLLPAVAKEAPAFIKVLYTDLAHPGIQTIGKSLAKAVEFCSIPFHFMGYVSDSVKMNLSQRLKEYGKKLEKVPEDKRCEVNPQIGAPILDHLKTTTNDEIADMFTTLLTNASNLDTLNEAHPSFAQLISRLSVDEARIIKYLKSKSDIPYCSFRAKLHENNGFITIIDRATLLPNEVELIYPSNTAAYLSNLTSLGVLVDREGLYITDDTIYNKLCEKNGLVELKERYKQLGYKDVTVQKSFYEVTPFGRLFIDACVKE